MSAIPRIRTTGESGPTSAATLGRDSLKSPMIPTPSTTTWVQAFTTISTLPMIA